MMTAIVTVFEAAGPMVLENNTENTETMMRQSRELASQAPPFAIEPAGQTFKRTILQFIYLGCVIHEDSDLMVEMGRMVRLMRACCKRFGLELNDTMTAPLSLKVRML